MFRFHRYVAGGGRSHDGCSHPERSFAKHLAPSSVVREMQESHRRVASRRKHIQLKRVASVLRGVRLSSLPIGRASAAWNEAETYPHVSLRELGLYLALLPIREPIA